ncbi:MAG: energy transducer TonB [Cyclobacteriaceae bacterium]
MKSILLIICIFSCSPVFGQTYNNYFEDIENQFIENGVFEESIDLEGLGKKVAMKLNYPESAKADSISGRVVVQFLLNGKGIFRKLSIVQGIRDDLDHEVLRVFKELRVWPPAIDKIKNPVRLIIPITFKMDKRDSEKE